MSTRPVDEPGGREPGGREPGGREPGGGWGEPAAVVDARGLRCPLPVIRLADVAAAGTASPGDVLEVWATDPAARADIPAWCRMKGHEYLGAQDRGDHTAYAVRVSGRG